MAAPTIVQHKSGFANGVLTGVGVTVTFTSNVTAGNLILALVGAGNNVGGNAITIPAPTMTGETFSAWTGGANGGISTTGQTAPFAVNSAAGGHNAVAVAPTWTGGGTDDIHMHIIEISGAGASPRDAQGNTHSTTLSVSTSGATTTATDLVIGFFFDNANNATLSATGGAAQIEQTNNTTGGDAGISTSKTVSSTGTQTMTASGNGTDDCNQTIVVVAGTSSTGEPDEDLWRNPASPWPNEYLVSIFKDNYAPVTISPN